MMRFLVAATLALSAASGAFAQTFDPLKGVVKPKAGSFLSLPELKDLPRITVSPGLAGKMPAGVRGKGCTFYEHINGKGADWKKPVEWQATSHTGGTVTSVWAQTMPTLGEWWNDRISSVQCDSGPKLICTALLYEHVNFKGSYVVVDGRSGRQNMPASFNDKASSIQIYCADLR